MLPGSSLKRPPVSYNTPITPQTPGQLLTAFSPVRKLVSSYKGSLMRVRRSTDDAEADIGFTASGVLDTAALLAHVGAASKPAVSDFDRTTAFTVSRNGGTVLQSWSPGVATASATFGAPFVMSRISDGATDTARFNGTGFTSSPVAHTATFDITLFRLGAYSAAGDTWGGGIGDVLIFADALADVDRLAVERDIGAFYGILVQ